MEETPVTSDFPLRPIGAGDTAVQIFQSAAEQSAAEGRSDDGEPPVRARCDAPIPSLLARLNRADGPVRLGRYDVIRCIGTGGMGVVYEAVNVDHGQRVALKTLRWMTAPGLRRFKNEFRSVYGVLHPNLVALHELAFVDDEWFFTMEYVEGVTFREYVRWAEERPSSFQYLGETLRVDEAPSSGGAAIEQRLREEARPLAEIAIVRSSLHEGRLRAALRDLAAGVAALHDAGKLHRDLNATNVLVTREGRVVVLDFGLATDRPRGLLRPCEDDGISGTPGYMAPEQAAGKPSSPASDWYGVGVMLFEALTGELPFHGNALRVLAQKQARDAPRPSSIARDIPPDLEELCVALLSRGPEERPGAAEVLRALGGARPRCPLAVPCRAPTPALPALPGRRGELRALDEALAAVRRGRPVTVRVQGPAGMGKSALLARFLDGLADRDDTIVLRGACREGESIPHRTLDALIDALARHLSQLGVFHRAEVQALLPPEARELSRIFPVLEEVEALVDLPPPASGAGDPEATRRAAFGALREILARMSDSARVVLCIDDLQWGDPGDVRLLGELLSGPDAPGILLLLAHRSEGMDANPTLRAIEPSFADGASQGVWGGGSWGSGPSGTAAGDPQRSPPNVTGARVVAVGPLDREAAVAVALAALPAGAEALAEASGGSPLFLAELCRWAMDAEDGAHVSLEQIVGERLARLPEHARRLAEVVAAAGRPIAQGLALEVARVGAEAAATTALLRAARVIRTVGTRAEDPVEIHDPETCAVVEARIAPAARRGIHLDLARALAARPGADPDTVADDFQRGGALDEAAAWAAAAAEQAVAGGAFDRAVEGYDRALSLRDGRDPTLARALEIARAHALAGAGRMAEAGDAYLACAREARSGAALDLRRRAGEALLIGGRIDEGVAVLRGVLAAHGIDYPETSRRALWTLGARLVQLQLRGTGWSERPEEAIDPAILARLDACWSAGKGLGPIDPIRSGLFLVEALRLALSAGDRRHVALGLGFVGCLLVYGGAAQEARGDALIEEAARIARRAGDPHLMGSSWACSGVARMCMGRWREALGRMDEGLLLIEEGGEGAIWERNAYRSICLQVLFALGALRERARRADAWLAEARARGDRHGVVEAQLGVSFTRLAAGDAAGAREDARVAVDRFWRGGFGLRHQRAAWLEASSHLYEGRPRRAWTRLGESAALLEGSQLLRIQPVRIDAGVVRGVAAIALAGEEPRARDAMLRLAEADAAALSREHRPHALAGAALVRAGAARLRGDTEGAIAMLGEAARGYAAVEMSVHAACVLRCKGELLGGAEGRRIVGEADAVLRAEGVCEPERWARMYTGISL
jgi:serine/threonine protein kinase